MYDVLIIGAGIIGTSIARELSKYNLKVCVLEKDNDVANGTTKANSAIIHAGYDAKNGTLKARLNVLGNKMFDELCRDLDVPFKRIGSLVLAFDDNDVNTLHKLYDNGIKNGVKDLYILSKEEVINIEPNVNKTVKAALYAKTAGIIGPFEMAIALAENAYENGVEFRLNSEVIDIKKEDVYVVYTKNEKFKARYVVNCAGLYADKINDMVSKNRFKIIPRRGEYYLLDKSVKLVNHIIFQCPTKLGKGVLITPTVHGNTLIGPNAEDLEDKEAINTTREGLRFVLDTAKKSVEDIPVGMSITNFAGLRARTELDDFIIKEAEDSKGFINVAGIESPGLSAAPAIALYVLDILKSSGLEFVRKNNFKNKRKGIIKFSDLSFEEKNELIKKDSRYGRIICRCEEITEGEIVDAIKRPLGATTLDGIKRRVRAGMGRCQGGFCSPRVMEILSRELKVKMEDIIKDHEGSYILTGPTKKEVD